MAYFDEQEPQLPFNPATKIGDVDIDGDSLRECQIGGYWAVRGHFTGNNSSDPALVVIPTGGGKTALMMLLCFGLKDINRVLIVSTSDTVRSQTAKKFQDLEGLTKSGLISGKVGEDFPQPSVKKIDERVTSEQKWGDWGDNDVFVALPHNISSEYNQSEQNNISPPPSDYFDLIFFDEAHHSRAKSWMELLNRMQDAKCVLLTATPFRRDERTLPGELVYHYPMSKAIDRDIYHQVAFEPVNLQRDDDEDRDMCEKAETIYDRMNGTLSASSEIEKLQTIVRTDEIDHADELEDKYDQHTDLTIEALHSDNTENQNEKIIRRLRQSEIDGVIAVGMLSEGLDIDGLKLAVLHRPPKSFPLTIQLIGRVTRSISDPDVDATVVADPHMMKENGVDDVVRNLYMSDNGWGEVIPSIVDRFVRDETSGSMKANLPDELIVNDIEPYLSATIYDYSGSIVKSCPELDYLDAIWKISDPNEEYLAFVTQQKKKPTWATNSRLQSPNYELHIYYYIEDLEMLFERTTSDRIGRDIRESITDENPVRIGPKRLGSVGKEIDEALNAGLTSNQFTTSGQAQYKMLVGQAVDLAINPADEDTYNFGHGFGYVDIDDEMPSTLGAASTTGTVWASGREKISQYPEWCDKIGQNISGGSASNIFGLGVKQKIEQFSSEPICALLNPTFYTKSIELIEWEKVDLSDNLIFDPANASLQVKEWNSTEPEVITLNLTINDGSPKIEIEYDVSTNSWSSEERIQLRVSKFTEETYGELELVDLMREHPPYFYTEEGDLIEGNAKSNIPDTQSRVPSDIFVDSKKIDWTGCDRDAEFEGGRGPDPEDGKQSVHEWTVDYIQQQDRVGEIIFRDHDTGEYADYIEFNLDKKEIILYHCKAGKTDDDGNIKTGASLERVLDGIEQSISSAGQVVFSDITDHIEGREVAGKREFIIGEKDFRRFKKKDDAGNIAWKHWDMRVVAIFPSLNVKKAQNKDNINMLFTTVYSQLRNRGVKFEVIGSGEDDEENE